MAKKKPESKKSRIQACQRGTTLMSLVTSCTLASLLLSLGKNLSFNKKLKKNTLHHQALKFLFLCFNRSYFSTLSEEKPITRAMASF